MEINVLWVLLYLSKPKLIYTNLYYNEGVEQNTLLKDWLGITTTISILQEGRYHVYYMENYCGQNIIVDPDVNPVGIIHLTQHENFMNVSEICTMNVVLRKGIYKLFMTFKMIHLDECENSYLQIDKESKMCASYADFGLENSLWKFTTLNQITLEFFHKNMISYNKGFTMVYSTLREGPCTYGEFKCENNEDRCLLNDFVCDGHNNCGDRSDEDSWKAGCRDKIDYMEDYCNVNFYIGQRYHAGGTIQLTRKNSYDLMENSLCNVNLKTSGIYEHVFIYFTLLDIGHCDDQHLIIKTSSNEHKVCEISSQSSREQYSYTSPKSISLRFTKSLFNLEKKKGFTLIYTSYREGTCSEGEFGCKNYNPTRCIPLELTCNAMDNCGDYSDEFGCLTVTAIAGIVVGGVSLIIIIIIICVIYFKKKRQKPKQNESFEFPSPI